MRNNNTIKDNSTGVQAGRDLTVNHTVNELPMAIQNMLIELLKPSIGKIGKDLEEVSSDLTKSIGKKIRTALEDGFVTSIKEKIKSENLNYHIEMVFKQIHADGGNEYRKREEIQETLEKTDLFLEWVENAEDVSPKDGILSKIWENWLYRLSKGEDTSNQKILLEKMKQLTPEDADFLLKSTRSSFFQVRLDGKLSYIAKRLSDMGLIKRSYYLEFLTFISSLIVISYYFNYSNRMGLPDVISQFETPLYLLCLILPAFFYNKMPSHRLTWIGNEIVSYAYPKIYRLNSDSLEKLKLNGVSKEILKKINALLYRRYYTESEFIEALLEHIDKEQLQEYKDLFLKYSVSSIN